MQVVAPGAIGGVETVITELLSAAEVAGTPAISAALIPPGSALPQAFEQLAAGGATVVCVDAPHRRYVSHYRAIVALLREQRATIVHSHGYHADVLCRFAARAVGIPHVSTLHGFVGGTRRGQIYELLQLRALRAASAVIAVSQAIRERAVQSGIAAAHVHVVPNAAPETAVLPRDQARSILGLDPNARVLGWVGRLSGEKDPESFVRLVASLAQSAEQTVGVIMGDGPLMPAVRASAQELLRDHQLFLPGVIKNAGTLLAALDALVVTSSTEGTPMVVLEAMRAGVPVVSTAVGGVPTMLGEDCGMLVPYGNDDALFHATTQVLSDKRLAQTLRENALARVAERYDRREWWKQHEMLYASLRRTP